MKQESKKYAVWLIVLLVVFVARVIIQMIQYFAPVSFFPEFSAWQSGILPYSGLVVAQIIIIWLMIIEIRRFMSSRVVPNRKRGKNLIIFAVIYFAVMLFRLIASLTFLSPDSPFYGPIPAFVHLLLALFVFIIGCYHRKYSHA